jgi:hypothetical protein
VAQRVCHGVSLPASTACAGMEFIFNRCLEMYFGYFDYYFDANQQGFCGLNLLGVL